MLLDRNARTVRRRYAGDVNDRNAQMGMFMPFVEELQIDYSNNSDEDAQSPTHEHTEA